MSRASLEGALQAFRAQIPALRVFDIHTHIGHADPDGFHQGPDELLRRLDEAGATAAVFPLREPGGYARANDAVLEAAAGSDGRLTPFCRVDPRERPVAEAERCLDAGARGVKLHPHSERFDLAHPGVAGVFALAAERRVPILIHAGSNIPPLGPTLLELCERHPGARVILAHGAVSDGAGLWDRAAEHPNLLFDLAWWDGPPLLELLRRVAPGRLLHGSDSPYGPPLAALVCTLRYCVQAGLGAEQIASVCGGQAARLLAGSELLDVGPAPGASRPAESPLAEELGSAIHSLFGSDLRQALEVLVVARAIALTPTGGPS